MVHFNKWTLVRSASLTGRTTALDLKLLCASRWRFRWIGLVYEIKGYDQTMAYFKRVSFNWLSAVTVERRASAAPPFVCLLETLIQQHTKSRCQWKIQLSKVGLKICSDRLPSNWEEVKLGITKRISVIRYSAFTIWHEACMESVSAVACKCIIMYRCDFLQFNARRQWIDTNMSDSFQGLLCKLYKDILWLCRYNATAKL